MPILGTVVLVPGLLGSRLVRRTVLAGDITVWLSPAALIAGSFPRVALPLPDQPGLPPEGTELHPGQPLGGLYGPLGSYLRHLGWRVVSPDLDWRRPLAEDGQRLYDLVRFWGTVGPCHAVAHSRGGLLVRWVVRRLAETGHSSWLNKVVGLGVPHLGAANAVTNLACASPVKDSIRSLGRFAQDAIGTGLGFDTVARVVRSLPSVYQLLPDPGRGWLPPVVTDEIYSAANYARYPSAPYQPYLDAARASWGVLAPVPDGYPWLDVFGVDCQTLHSPLDLTVFGLPAAWSTTMSGDGTVLVTSAHDPARRYVQTRCSHDLLPADGRVWPYLAAYLAFGLSSNVSIGGPVLSLPS